MDEIEIKSAIRAERARIAREWRRKNPEKVKAATKRYWERKALKILSERQEEAKKAEEEAANEKQ